MIRVSMTSSDVDKQIEVLRHFPDIADRHYRPALKRDTALLLGAVASGVPVRTGTALASLGSRVTGRAFSLKGQVGWYDSGDPWYTNVVEHGAKPHEIKVYPRSKKVLAWPGGFSQGHTISHPGFSAVGFMAAGYSAVQPVVEQDLALANERIIAELAAI